MRVKHSGDFSILHGLTGNCASRLNGQLAIHPSVYTTYVVYIESAGSLTR